MKKEKKTPDEGVLSRIKARYTEAVSATRDTVVLNGQQSATVYGCQRILFYSPCEIRLQLRTRALSVVGERLYCSSFTAATVTVVGRIEGVRFVSEDFACKESQ